MDDNNNGNAAAIIEHATKTTEPKVLTVNTPWGTEEQVLVTTKQGGGASVESARSMFSDEQPAPEMRAGTIVAHDPLSFVDLVNRDKRDESVIFADVPNRSMTAVLDFHGPADSAPSWMRDRVAYGFKLSKQLEAWIESERRGPMSQKDFSRLIDDRLGDIGEGPFMPGSFAAEFAKRRGINFASVADLVVFTRTIAAKSTTDSVDIYDENTGGSSIQYAKRNDVKTPDGAPVAVPAAFALHIPVLNGLGATEYDIAVRLRYDIDGKGIVWRVELHALDKYIQAAIEQAVTVVRAAPEDGGCGLPVYMAAAP